MNIQINIPIFLSGHVKFINWWHVIFLNKYGPVTADRHVTPTWQHWDSHPFAGPIYFKPLATSGFI
jgi:hypothetical protein